MEPKELVRRAIHFGRPERPPLVFRKDPERSDIITIGYGPPGHWQPTREGEDEWGLVWRNIIGTGLGQVVSAPLEDAPDLAGYAFPDAHAPGRYGAFEAGRARYRERYVAGGMGLSGFTVMMLLRGFEALLTDLYAAPDFVACLADAVFAFEVGIIEEYVRRGADGVWFFDDLGTERGLMMRPDTWRAVFKPRYRAEFALAHERGLEVLFHSCGNVWEAIPELIEIGVDVLNVEQPLVFGTAEQDGIERLAEHFGGRACFCTNVDSQRTLISGTPAQIEEEVQHLVRALARPEGGLIPLADCGADHGIVPPENVRQMSEAFWRWSRGEMKGATQP